MINIVNKQDCCGCTACVQRCPKQCISLQGDEEGFLYPKVNVDDCIECGLCEKVCPVIHPYEKRIPLHTFAAINNDEEIRMQSSSGGVFTLIAEKVIDDGGVVFGARFDEKWQVVLDYTETKDGLAAFRGSKYVQARIEDTYKQCEKFLKEERKVLYSGTPCQISGLKHFLRKEYDNLLTVDFVCHGVPSPKAWRKYLSELTSKEFVQQISMRAKNRGWKDFSFKVDYDKDKSALSFISLATDNAYMKAFLSDLILRPSCHSCVAKECSSNSDITIADFWGIWEVNPAFYDDKGTSVVLIHNQKLEAFFKNLNLRYSKTSYEDVVKYNSALVRSSRPHKYRKLFWTEFEETKSFSKLVSKHTFPRGLQAIKYVIKIILKKIVGGG